MNTSIEKATPPTTPPTTPPICDLFKEGEEEAGAGPAGAPEVNPDMGCLVMLCIAANKRM